MFKATLTITLTMFMVIVMSFELYQALVSSNFHQVLTVQFLALSLGTSNLVYFSFRLPFVIQLPQEPNYR